MRNRFVNIISSLKSSTFIRDSSILIFGTFLAQGIGLLITPILSRLYLPEDFGMVSLVVSISTVSATLISMSYPIRIVLPKSDIEARQLSLISILLTLTLGSILLFLSLLPINNFLTQFNLSGLGLWFQFSILLGIIMSLNTTLTNWMNRNSAYLNISKLKILQAFFIAFIGLFMGLFNFHDGLLYGQFIGLIITFLIFIYFSSLRFKLIDFKGIIDVARKHSSAPKYLYPTALLDVFTSQLPFFLISLWFSSELVGHYRMSISLLSVPSAIVGVSISQAFYKKFSTLWPDVTASKYFLLKTWATIALIGFVPFTIVFFYGEDLFKILLGDNWGMAGKMASYLALMSYASLIHSPTSTTLVAMGHDRLLLFFGIAVLIHRPLSFYLGYLYGDLFLALKLFVLSEILHFIVFQKIVINKLNKTLVI